MPLPSEQVWHRWSELFNRGDVEGAIEECVHPDIEWVPITVEGTVFHGKAGVRQWVDQHFGFWETFELHPEEVLDAGPGRLLVLGSWRAKGRGSGLGFEKRPAGWLLDFRDGKVVRMETFTEIQAAMEAAGL
ncbi:MAG: nuclear transport factor 2 family protein [Thermoleophilaceae bacterium]|nr:nuclear transport factor 2 family protein [Thermoleophilaceae bacterium]